MPEKLTIAIVAALAFLILMMDARVAFGHEFYDGWCCNENDCAPYEGVVELRPDGFWLPEFNTLVPYKNNPDLAAGVEPRIRYDVPSHDKNQYHLCEYPIGSGKVRCFYAKPGGV